MSVTRVAMNPLSYILMCRTTLEKERHRQRHPRKRAKLSASSSCAANETLKLDLVAWPFKLTGLRVREMGNETCLQWITLLAKKETNRNFRKSFRVVLYDITKEENDCEGLQNPYRVFSDPSSLPRPNMHVGKLYASPRNSSEEYCYIPVYDKSGSEIASLLPLIQRFKPV